MKSAQVVIRPWERGDFARLAAAGPRLSARTLHLRFWSPVPVLPASYLRSTEQRWPRCWDAVVAIDGDLLAGWAEYGRSAARPDTADVAVCVVDAQQGHGIGTALLERLVAQARAAGLVSVHADIEWRNAIARHAWQHVTGGRASTYALAG
ncbi:MAG TPA: GNAT family N-acetyltransferase [Jatrophihabitans sp.]|jgi:GNAT superfamily N-acetyltransferase|uniref:GNAT family N-acetyltransferase n=1 Tax=Jatrophihabitans sp. TaxID=1932789 RepID=UPI002DFA35AB|nr:GNAT family N-acetyltransferase [Jatrophihabitans sp.]